MEQLVLTMSDVRFPAMRREVVRALASLADIDYQRRARVGGEFSEPTVYEDLTMNINVLFDDTQVLPDPRQRLGTVLFAGDEVPALAALGALLDEVLDRLGTAGADVYIDDHQWPEVAGRAPMALAAMVRRGD